MFIEEKGKGVKYVATWSVVGVEEDPSQFNNKFYWTLVYLLTPCLLLDGMWEVELQYI
jgi:hypothetical protein